MMPGGMGLTGKRTALITGGAHGLGRHLACTLAKAGYRVAVSYRSSRREAEELAEALTAAGAEAMAVQADMTDAASLAALVRRVEDRFGGIDALVNNAGPFERARRRLADYRPEDIRYLLDANLWSVMELDRLVIPGMRSRGFGRIIHFGYAGAAEARGWPQRAAYAAAKAGLVALTKSLAVEEAPFGITVNMVCPGDIKGDNKEKRIRDVAGLVDPESPRIRPGAGEDVSRVIAFLLSEASDFVTGAVIDVTGGMDPIRNWPLKGEREASP